MSAFLRQFGILAIVGGLALSGSVWAEGVPLKDGNLIVHDDDSVFSPEGIRKAKDEFARLHTRTGREVTIQTLKKLPDTDKNRYEKIAKDDKGAHRRFWSDYARWRRTNMAKECSC